MSKRNQKAKQVGDQLIADMERLLASADIYRRHIRSCETIVTDQQGEHMLTSQHLRLVRVEWTGPLTYSEVVNLNSLTKDYGLYQICAYHNVFGPQSLIYIGKAQLQTFAVRFSQHWQDWLKRQREVKIYVGRMFREDFSTGDDHADWNQLLTDLECLTIHTHSPPFNSVSIGQYSGQPLHVQFWGDRGALMQEFSSHWVEARPDDEQEE